MSFQPFIYYSLRNHLAGQVRFGVPIQLSLLPECQAPMSFASRLHHASHLHFDFRLRILQTLFSLVLFGPPDLNPAKRVGAKLMANHDPRYLDSERVIPEDQYGAGPTMPVDLGGFVPIVRTYATYEMEVLDQIARGDFRFIMNGEHLKGAWQLRCRGREFWDLRKLEDEHASTTRILMLDRSVKTGRTLSELIVDERAQPRGSMNGNAAYPFPSPSPAGFGG